MVVTPAYRLNGAQALRVHSATAVRENEQAQDRSKLQRETKVRAGQSSKGVAACTIDQKGALRHPIGE